MLVRDVMTSAVVSAHTQAVFKDIVAAMARNHVSVVPVLDDGRRVVGVVSASDLLARISGDRGEIPRGHRLAAGRERRRKVHGMTAADLMTAPAVTIADTARAKDAARTSGQCHVRTMPVVDDTGELVGMVSRTDLLKPFLRDDADIRREITDDVMRVRLLLDPDQFDVMVRSGIVRLIGLLDRRAEAEALCELVSDLDGVIGVDDRVGYRVDDVERPPAATWAR